MTELIRFVFK